MRRRGGDDRRTAERGGRRTEWSVRLLDLACTRGTGREPGLLLFQVDGLSFRRFREALDEGRLPFLRALIDREGYAVRPLFAGVPSTTPAAQGELFYGVRRAVPAFAFVRRAEDRGCIMYDVGCVNRVAHELERRGEGLLAGGTAYSHLYTGGAEEARYCIQTLNLRSFLQSARPSRAALVILFHLGHFVRVAGLAALELVLAVTDLVRGLLRGREFSKELKFVLTRIGVCIVVRELIRFRAKLDAARGMPVVSANFVGYDEHSHRRGPDSPFARWTLRGIDAVLGDVYRTARSKGCRDYRMVVYSDHGQEHVEPYERRFGRPLRDAVTDVFREGPLAGVPVHSLDEAAPYSNLYHRGRSLLWSDPDEAPPPSHEEPAIRIASMGPLGHLYLPRRLPEADLAACARALVARAGVPLVLYRSERGVVGVTAGGEAPLSEGAASLVGAGHPHLREVGRDLAELARHPDAGDLVLSGWTPAGPPLTFAVENGAHGGPGTEEVLGFAVLPPEAEAPSEEPFRLLGLRAAALALLGRNRS